MSASFDDLTCVVVTRNCAELMTALLDRLPKDAHLVIAENASTDDTLARIEASAPHARVLDMGSNLGFGRAANRALAEVSTEFVCLLMPCAWAERGAFGALLSAADKDRAPSFFIPRLVDEFGVPLPAEPGPPPLSEGHPDQEEPETARNFALFARTDALRQLGGFDEAILHFGEAQDLCRRAKEAGSPARFVPQAEFMCPSHGIPGSRVAGRQFAHAEWAAAYLAKKHADAEADSEAFQTRLKALERQSSWHSLLGRNTTAAQARWRAIGLGGFLDGLSADELQQQLDALSS